jgi:glucose-1-phosphate thymidylyltransferase
MNTLIRADFELDPQAVIWVKQVDQPEAFGVVKLNATNDDIIELVEKKTTFVSDLAVIGIYYFKEVGDLKTELQKLEQYSKWW